MTLEETIEAMIKTKLDLADASAKDGIEEWEKQSLKEAMLLRAILDNPEGPTHLIYQQVARHISIGEMRTALGYRLSPWHPHV